jgi:hypothetical protein
MMAMGRSYIDFLTNLPKKLAAPKGVPERSPSSVLTGPCDG